MAQIKINDTTIQVAKHTILSQAIGLHQPLFEQPCAGLGRCGKCRVVASGALSLLSPAERTHLSNAEIAAGVRLACQCTVLGDCTVHIQTQTATQSQIQIAGVMPAFAPAPYFTHYGVALDIGTTTLAALLFDATGNCLATASAPNPQATFGADVVSRIEGALAGNGAALADCIRAGVSDLLLQLCAQGACIPAEVEQIVITGNTCMLYLLTQRSPEPLSHAPFAADCLFDIALPAADLALPCPNAQVYLPPCISAFVGADITTALLASDICNQDKTALLADIGTNGEMALWHNGQLHCCSTAAGPAFEGAGLSMGVAGKDGAIDKVTARADGGYDIHTIGEIAPLGICGSGIVDAIAAFLQSEEMDETGLLEEATVLLGQTVTVTQADVRMVQLAKSAICAGMQTLVENSGLNATQISTLSLAGGFGSYLNLTSAAAIGLFPPEYLGKTKVIGNAALSGAAMLLLQPNYIAAARELAQHATTLDLAANPRFSEHYMMGMLFGEE